MLKNTIFILFFIILFPALLKTTEPGHNLKMHEIDNCNFLYGSLKKTADEIKTEKEPIKLEEKVKYKINLEKQINDLDCKELLKK